MTDIPVEIIIPFLNLIIFFNVGKSAISPEPILKTGTSLFISSAALKENGVTSTINYSPTEMEAFPVWSLDKSAWRSFRLDTVESWEAS